MSSNVLIIIVTILTFIASEFFLPLVYGDTPVGKRQRHFYSILLSVASLVMTLTLTTALDTQKQLASTASETQRQLAAVEKVFTTISDSPVKQHFQAIFTNYHNHFKPKVSSAILESWVHKAIESLSTDMKEVSISLPSSVAKPQLLNLYSSANDYIIATHVGFLEEYFASDTYWNAERNAVQRGIPVIRFYLFDGVPATAVVDEGSNVIVQTFVRGSDKLTLSEYNKRVATLHKDMNTVMSVVISPDQLNGIRKRAIVLADGEFVVETEIGTDITRATGRETDLRAARQFLRELLGKTVSSMDYVHYLPDSEIRRLFVRYKQIDRRSDEPLAKSLARHLLRARDE